MGKLNGKAAIVTGVSRPGGIGAAICRALAGEGASVFFTHLIEYDRELYPDDADEHWPDAFVRELAACGVSAAHMRLDLADPESPVRLLAEARSTLGMPSILVNNATYSIDSNYRDLTADLIDAHCAVNMRGTFMLSVLFARMLEAEQAKEPDGFGGRIISLTSGQGKVPMPGNLAYAATKGAISTFTECLAAEIAQHGITVNAIDPGPTDSGWMTDEIRQALQPRFPMGRIGLPDDAARLAAFLACEDARWITGQIIHSRGGF